MVAEQTEEAVGILGILAAAGRSAEVVVVGR
jgi:hypothetical protein